MLVLADAHVHVYPTYDATRVFNTGIENLESLRIQLIEGVSKRAEAEDSHVKVFFLTERFDCHFFRELADQGSDRLDGSFQIERAAECDALTLLRNGTAVAYLFAGRQIVTRERVEILALATDSEIPDGLSVRESIEAIRTESGIPVVNWAPGKWFFQRGKIVASLLAHQTPRTLLLGDTTLRPVGWAEPRLMRQGREHGFKVVAGSDPLPFEGEEQWVGRYGIAVQGSFDPRMPTTSIREMLLSDISPITPVGRRCSVRQVADRLRKNQSVRRSYEQGRQP